MDLKLVLVSAACLSYFVIHAAAAARSNLLTTSVGGNGIYLGADLAALGLGPLLGTSNNGDDVVIQIRPEAVAAEATPAQEAVVQQPVVQQYKPVQPISLVPVATISSPYSFPNKVSSLWGGISNVINAKTKAVGDFLRSFRGPPQIVLINVDKPTTTTTTTTTKKPMTNRPLLLEIVALPQRRAYPLQPVPVIEDCNKK